MENTLGLDQQVRAVTGAIGGRPVRVGPVTLASLDGPWPSGASRASGLPPQVDPRQPSLFTAAWTVAALATLLSSGAQSLTLFETCGWRGIEERPGGSARPDAFLSRPGGATPSGMSSPPLPLSVMGGPARLRSPIRRVSRPLWSAPTWARW